MVKEGLIWAAFSCVLLPVGYLAGMKHKAMGGLYINSKAKVWLHELNNAQFSTPEASLGLMPGWGGTQRLPRMIPWAKAAEMLLGGEIIDAQEAYRIGLVNEVVPAK